MDILMTYGLMIKHPSVERKDRIPKTNDGDTMLK